MTAKSLQYKPPGANIKWSMALKSISELSKVPSGYLSSGKIDFQVDPKDIARSSETTKLSVWQCQVCEEVNETSGTKCQICGSIQKGDLLEIKLDKVEETPKSVPWKCEVCEEKNEGTRSHCSSCGFGRPKQLEKADNGSIMNEKWTCSTCTFINTATTDGASCQVCEAPRVSQQISIAKPRYRLSFKSGGSTVFFSKLKAAWQVEAAKPNATAATPEDSVTIGISGLLRRQEERNLAAEASLSSAFSDLDALMRSAGEMVQLASKISEKLACTSGDLSSKERNTFNDLVESLGMEIHEAAAESQSQAAFYDSIAKNVSTLVQTMIAKTGTRVYSLADIYCIYNRTRTTGSLIAPADLLKAARLMSRLGLPVRLHKFTAKGMLCLVPAQDIDPLQLFTLIQHILQDKDTQINAYVTAVDLAEKSRISLFLAGQQLEMAERAGKIVRDGKRKDLPAFYLNIFT